MTKPAEQQPMVADAAPAAPAALKRTKVPAFLLTEDVELWPQIGSQLPAKLSFRQLDSIGELMGGVAVDTPAVVLWDARGCADKAAELSRIQSHSARFAIGVLDEDGSAWAAAIQRGQIVGVLALPLDQGRLAGALAAAYEEVRARLALLGEPSAAPGPADGRKRSSKALLAGGIVAAAIAATLALWRHGGGDSLAPDHPSAANPPPAQTTGSDGAQPLSGAPSEDKVDALIDQAQRAMRDRHFIDPPEGSALALYRSALVLDPASGEARQGLQRLAEVLLARVQSALDQRQFDAALQALENARSIDPGDKRLAALDERVARMRAELGPAEILAAINAQNFDRASQLIEQAMRSRSIGGPRLNQLRESLRKRRGDSDAARLVALIDTRMQQDQLAAPPNDSAVYYLTQARKVGATSAALQSQFRELSRRLTLQARADIGRRQLDDAGRLVSDLHGIGMPLAQIAGLQHEIGLARAARVQASPASGPAAAAASASIPAPAPEQLRLADLARTRLAQGSVTQPPDDSALHYLRELQENDPENAALGPLSAAVQAQILAQARAALDASQPGQAELLLQLSASIGPSPEADALRERLRIGRPAAIDGPPEVSEASLTRTRTLDIEYPSSALANQVEGQVEVGYLVTPKGAVSGLKVLSATSPGVFDRAATSAVSRLKYKPVLDAGKPITVSTKMLVIFRLAK